MVLFYNLFNNGTTADGCRFVLTNITKTVNAGIFNNSSFLCYINFMIKHIYDTRVYYADTDAYGVVWHGAYIRWLEKGRVELCDMLGLDLVSMKNNDVLIPVTNMNIRYKASAKLDDRIIVESWVEKCNGLTVTFKQAVKSKDTGKLFVEAAFDCVAVTNDGKLYRRMPQELIEKFEKGVLCPATV